MLILLRCHVAFPFLSYSFCYTNPYTKLLFFAPPYLLSLSLITLLFYLSDNYFYSSQIISFSFSHFIIYLLSFSTFPTLPYPSSIGIAAAILNNACTEQLGQQHPCHHTPPREPNTTLTGQSTPRITRS